VATVVEPVLSEEKLRAVLAEGCEQRCLDFKTISDLSLRYDVAALVKDIAGMFSNELGGGGRGRERRTSARPAR